MKTKLPKSVYLTSDNNARYKVSIYSKVIKKTIHVGYFDSLLEAITMRDEFILSNYEGLTAGYLPIGISFIKTNKKYEAYFTSKTIKTYLGLFETLGEAVEKRNHYIDSLK